MHGEDQNPTAEIERAYFLGRLQPTHDRHRDVQDNHVWFVFHDGPYRFLPVFRLSHDLPVLASLQDGPQALAHNFVVINDQNLNVHPKSPSQDRKSTRLNSSHGSISYAVF